MIKRSGGDGTEFPLTATCLFGRNTDCDIRIQLPQVSREHCRIDLNENKEVVLTNLSSANPTRVNGEALQQSERLKHGDVITIIDRSFRFEYPPAPTPKKRSSRGGKTETLKVLQDQQDSAIVGTGEKRISEISTDPHLKDAANHDNIQRSLEKTMEMESKGDDSPVQSKTVSPFNDLYQMIKKSLDVKTPRKSSASLLQTPSSKLCSPKPGSVRKSDSKFVVFAEGKTTPKKVEAKVLSGTPESVKKQKKVVRVPSTETAGPTGDEAEHPTVFEAASPRRKSSATPQKFTLSEVIEQVTAPTPKSPVRRRSKEGTPAKPAVASPKAKQSPKASPRSSEKAAKVKEVAKKRKSGELGADLPTPKMKKKRVSFGSFLSPELFDKRLPPDSPLRKGATPRRSLSLLKPKQSLLRRASVIGLLKECDKDELKKSPSGKSASPKTPTSAKKSPKSRSTSPKAASPRKNSPKSRSSSPTAASPAKKSPKSRSPSPKAASPGKNSPKSRSSSPKAATPAKKSPKSKSPSPKAASPGKKSPKATSSKAASPTGKRRSSLEVSCPASQENAPSTGVTPVKTPVSSGVQTPSVQGRFSVSRISTPSPAVDAVTDQVPSVTATPKIPIRRKSMKSASRKTPSISKSAVKMLHRRSGLSRVSMKAANSWANIVKFGETKAPIVAPPKKMIAKKTTKKAVPKLPKPQTPARKLKGLVSTGHANSPATIVVGRAHKQKVVHPTGAAPRVVTNTALLKKNMKMDEDLTGISEMFKTPVNERKRRSVINENSALKTPAGGLGTSVIEPSVLNTPEEPDEMMVSPLSVASTVKGRQYNREAVQRLLNGDQESSFVGDIPALETQSECSEEQHTDIKTASVNAPKQKPELPESLTGVKRIMKTPRQKAEPVEDLRGKLLKTPKQKSEQKECLSGIKRIMKTPRQKAEPVEDLRGKILKTPKQKAEQQECLTGVKRIMKTPRQKAEPLEDIRGKLLTTPKQKPAQQECLTGVKRIFETPKQAEPIEDLRGKLLKTPEAPEANDVSLDGDKEVLQTPANVHKSEDLSEMTNTKTPDMKSSPMVCLTGIKRIMKTPKQKSAPVEDMVGVKRLMRTPREKGEPVEENFGIKRLMKSPRLRGIAPVEDFEGLQELMEEPLTDPTGQLQTNEDEDQMPVDGGVDVTTEAIAEEAVSDHLEEPSGMETVSQAAADENVTVEQSKVDTVDENAPEVESAAGKVTEMDAAVTDLGNDKKSARGRRAKTAESKPAHDKQEAPEPSEEPVVAAPVRGRRGKKTEATAPPAVRQTARGRNAKTTESRDVELTVEESAPQPSKVAPKPKRGRNAKKVSDDYVEVTQEVVSEIEMVVEPESETSPAAVDADHKANDSAVPVEKAVVKPRRGRKAKQPEQLVPEQQDEPCMQTEDVPQAGVPKADANEACSDQMEVMPAEAENKSDSKKTILQTPETESLPDVETAACKVTEVNAGDIEKKSVRGRRAKVVESKEAEDDQEAAQHSEEPVIAAPVRGRRGRKVEATAPPAVRQTKRGRNAKSQESSSDQPAVETQLMTEVPTEAAGAQTSLLNASQENGSAPPAEEAVVKPLRGRKTKQTLVEPAKPEPEQNEAVSGEQAQPQQHIPATAAKPRRGRKTKLDTEEQHEIAEETVVKVETTLQSEPPVRSKRGRNAKQEDKVDTNVKTAESQEPVQKGRRARKVEQDHVEPREEVQTTEEVVPEKEEAPTAEPVSVSEQAPVTTKPRRGGRKAKQDIESVTPVESIEVQEVPVVSSTNKPQRGRRGKQACEEAVVTAEDPECDLEAEEKKNAEPAAPVAKPSKARGAKTSVKSEISQTVPAKRARRGAAPPPPPEDTSAESTASATTSVEPAKRGRRAAAKPTADEPMVTSDQANPSEDVSKAVVEDTKTSKRSVRWKSDVEVVEIPKVTPVKAVRGRKSKLGDQVENKSVSQDANKPEEEDLSDKVVEARPTKRARRGAAADKAEATSQVDLKEAETQPKTRRGRSTKK